MSLLWGVVVASVLSQAPGLPPGHPELPADHPELPADHPELPPGHPKVSSGKEPPSAQELIRELDAQKDLKTRDKTFEVAEALGKLYYANGRYADAVDLLRQAMTKAEPLRKLWVDLGRKAGLPALGDSATDVQPKKLAALADALQKHLGDAGSLGCALASDSEMEPLFKRAEEKAKAGALRDALTCAHAAAEAVVEAEALYANALALVGKGDDALSAYASALQLFPTDEESLYGYAAALWDLRTEDAHTLKTAEGLLDLDLKRNPKGLHAAAAQRLSAHLRRVSDAGGFLAYRAHAATAEPEPQGTAPVAPPFAPPAGSSSGPLSNDAAPPPLSPAVVDAVRNTEMTPEVVKGLDQLVETAEEHLAHQRFQDALDAYKRVVPFEPTNGRARAGMAWSLVGLNRQPMADRIWMVAVQSDAAAVDQLGDRLAQKGDKGGAVSLWKKLRESAPEYASSSGLAKKIP